MILAEDIAMVLEDAYWLGNDAARGRREDDSSMLIARGYTDRILALIAEALLTDEAVEAGGKSVHHHFGQGNWERVTRNEAVLARWRGEDNTRPATGQYVATAKETITAALDALLGKETHDDRG